MKEAGSPGKGETGLTFSAFYYDDYSDRSFEGFCPKKPIIQNNTAY